MSDAPGSLSLNRNKRAGDNGGGVICNPKRCQRSGSSVGGSNLVGVLLELRSRHVEFDLTQATFFISLICQSIFPIRREHPAATPIDIPPGSRGQLAGARLFVAQRCRVPPSRSGAA